jgi:hypothetical protein
MCASSLNKPLPGGYLMRFRQQILTALPILILCMCVVALSSPLPIWGQAVSSGTVVGTVTDQSGAVVSAVKVDLTDLATSTTRSVTANETGHYVFVDVPPGQYTMAVSKQGFSTTKTTTEVKVGLTTTVNLSLQVGGANVVVEVEAAGTELQTMDATVGQIISGNALDSLPGLGRDVSTFVELQPGVAPDGSVAGANQDQNSFLLDGGNNSSDMDGTQNTYTPSFASDPTGGLVGQVTGTAVPGAAGGGGPTGVMPTPADSIEEFRVGTNNQTADFNSSAGAQVRLVTKRGTNSWHGTAYEYYLDNNWAANTFDSNLAGTRRPSYHYNRFGGAIGGPLFPKEVLGGKTFFFANYEGFRWPNSASTTKATPSADMRLGLLTFGGTTYNLNPYPVTSAEGVLYAANAGCAGFPGGVCDPRGIGMSPTVQALFQYMPAPTTTTQCLGLLRCDKVNVQAFHANYPLLWKDDIGVFRLDHDFGSKWHFYSTYRYYHQRRATANQIDIGGFFPGDKLGVPASVASRPQVPWYLTGSLSTNITSSLTNSFDYSFLRNYWARSSKAQPPQVPGLGGALEPFGEDSSNVLSPFNVDTQDVRTRFWNGDDHMIRDDMSWLKGNHFFAFGGLYQHNFNWHQRTDNGGGINYQTVYWLGRSIGTLNGMNMSGYVPAGAGSLWSRDYGIVLGVPGVTEIAYTRTGANLQLNPPNTPAFDKSTIPFYNLYVNDSWRLKPTFTLSYGLGWALEMPPKEENGKQVSLVDASGNLIDVTKYLNTRASQALAGQVYNPEVGFSLIGNVTGHPSHLYNPFYKSFSPRIAAAWNPHFDGGALASIFGRNETVVRGGYSILYGRLNGVALVLIPLLGTGLIQPVQCIAPLANGNCAGSGGSSPATSFRICPTAYNANCGGLVAPLPAADPTLPQPDFPGYNAIAAGASEGIDPSFRPSMNQQYDLTIQRQINSKMSVEVGYIGRHMTHEFQPIQINAVPYMMTLGGQRFDKAYGQMVWQYCGGGAGLAGGNCAATLSAVTAQPFFETALAGTGYCTTAVHGITPASCTQAVALHEGNTPDPITSKPFGTGNIGNANVWSLWSDLDNGGFNFSRSMMNTPIPGSPFGANGQLSSGVGMNTSLGYANYNALFVSYKMSSWHGLTLQSNFTWSKALGTVSQVQATSQYGISDPFYFGRNYGYQPWDRKFLFNVWFTYTPPVFQGQHGALGRALGGWTFAPILDLGSGLPLGIYGPGFGSSVYAGGQAFGAMDGGNFGDYENAINMCGGSLSTSRHNTFNSSGGFGSAAPANLFSDPGAVYNCFRNPILGIDNGHNGGIGNYRGQPFWNVDFSIKKNLLVYERFSAEFGAVFSNIFNHNQLSDPGLTFLSDPADFGTLESSSAVLQVDNPRKIEVAVRVRF